MVSLLFVLALLMPMPATAIQIVILDVNGVPVSGVAVTLQNQQQTVRSTTNASGVAFAQHLNGSAVFVIDAVLPDGKRVQIDPTTPQDGMRLGLIPNETRHIVLRFDPATNLLFVDPEALFSGEVLPTPMPSEAQAAAVEPPPVAQLGLPPFVKGLLVFAVAIGGIALGIWVYQIYRYRKSRSGSRT